MNEQKNPLEIIAELQKKISEFRKEIIEQMKLYSESQKETWRQIPFFALEADGRSGFSDSYSVAYRNGFWRISSSVAKHGSYTVCVDLETGQLVNAFNVLEPATDRDLLRILADELDASKIIEELKGRVAAPFHWSQEKRKEEIEQWRAAKRAELGLEKVYTRKKT